MKGKFELAQRYMRQALPNVKVELMADCVDGKPGIVIDDWITIWSETVLGFQVTFDNYSKIVEECLYHIDLAVDIPGGKYEPPSVDVVEAGTARYFHSALEIALTAWLHNDIHIFFDNESWKQWAEEVELEALSSPDAWR